MIEIEGMTAPSGTVIPIASKPIQAVFNAMRAFALSSSIACISSCSCCAFSFSCPILAQEAKALFTTPLF
jgi:hypothetical protein